MDYILAFLVGGVICALAQILIDFTKITPARIMVFYVVLGVALTAVGVYPAIVEFAGAGATVPIIGFGYVLATSVREAVASEGLLGIFTGGLGGVAGGISAAILFGYLFALVYRNKRSES